MTSITTRPIAISLVAAATIFAGASAALEEALTKHPDPKRAAYYTASESTIDELRARIADTNRPGADRARDLDDLLVRFPDAAITTAAALISDRSLEVAQAAARILADSIVMSDHEHGDHAALTVHQKYVLERHEKARAALQTALEDPRPEIRAIAAPSLASLADDRALRTIQEGIGKGIYSEVEAVNYFGLADPDKGAKYMLPYLEQGNASARAAAAGYLGANPTYQPVVRDKIFLNPDVDVQSRTSAAKILSHYDQTFESYALTVTADPNVSPQLYTVVMEGYVDKVEAEGKLDPARAEVLKKAVDNFVKEKPSADLKRVQERLERASKR